MALTKISRGLLNTGISDSSDATAITIDSSENVLVGSGTSNGISGGTTGLQVSGAGFKGLISATRHDNNAFGSGIMLGKSRNTTVGSNTIVQDDDAIGAIGFFADDGTNLDSQVAYITASVDGSPAANDTPGRLTFSTTADGSAAVTERMRITSSGKVGINEDVPQQTLSVGVTSGSLSGISLTLNDTDLAAFLTNSSTGEVRIGGVYTNYFPTFYSHNAEQMRLATTGNLHLSGGSDRRIQLGNGGAGANQVSNNTVHIRADGTSMKLMAASGGELLYEQNGTEHFRITSTGILRNTAGDGMVKIEVPAYISLADDSSVSIFVDTAGSSLVSVYEGGTGSGALVWLNYATSSGGNFLKSGGNSNFSSSDTDGQLCVIKSANSHSATIKNRLGGTINLAVGVYGTKIDSAS